MLHMHMHMCMQMLHLKAGRTCAAATVKVQGGNDCSGKADPAVKVHDLKRC